MLICKIVAGIEKSNQSFLLFFYIIFSSVRSPRRVVVNTIVLKQLKETLRE